MRYYYLWKDRIECENNKGFKVKGFYKSKERKKKEIINRINYEKGIITYGELKGILIKIKNLQRDTFKEFIKKNWLKDLSEEKVENILKSTWILWKR